MQPGKFLKIISYLILIINLCNAKGFRRGGGGGGAKGGGAKTSKTSSTSNIGPPVNGNSGNNNGNTKISPNGPPPAYPGLQNEAVSSLNNPPPYSLNANNYPPPYSPGFNARPGSGAKNSFPFQNTYKKPTYGSTFGSSGLPSNTYISNNFFGSSRSKGLSGFLVGALFYGTGFHHGYLWGSGRKWDEDDDRRWRATTKAPYFENKVPGADVILPASAVVGAATAFGLTSLLPLNVPSNKPLMYCNSESKNMTQAKIEINGNVYECTNETFLITKLDCADSSLCRDEISMNCDGNDLVYCTNGTLLSRFDIFCNSTTIINGTAELNQSMILNCYEGILPEKQTAYIPTTEAPITEKSLSFPSKVHIFLLRIIGKEDVIKIKPKKVEASDQEWIPEALTIPPEIIKQSNDLESEDENQSGSF